MKNNEKAATSTAKRNSKFYNSMRGMTNKALAISEELCSVYYIDVQSLNKYYDECSVVSCCKVFKHGNPVLIETEVSDRGRVVRIGVTAEKKKIAKEMAKTLNERVNNCCEEELNDAVYDGRTECCEIYYKVQRNYQLAE